MKAPQIPSFFKSQQIKNFNFLPRYYKEKINKKIKKKHQHSSKIKFERITNPYTLKRRNIKIFFLIIILSLLAFILLK